jgi:cellulose synthase/poly-beta-1,6-N-acetylglucosamine synthase-like glycosyltransferase
VGGYKTGTIGEDMELILRIHRYHRLKRLPYRVHFMADPVCWTEAPEDFKTLKNQRVRWHRGLAESLSNNIALFFNPRAGFVGLFAFPFFIFFELLGPIVELVGFVFMILAVLFGWIPNDYILALSIMAMCSGLFVSTVGILLEEVFFHAQVRVRDVWWLYFCTILENFGYRQLNTVYQFTGLMKWLGSGEGEWGKMNRNPKWATKK